MTHIYCFVVCVCVCRPELERGMMKCVDLLESYCEVCGPDIEGDIVKCVDLI